ncbi:MAG: hypothetical protein HFH53_09955 [Hespellia sp.]|jgi:hypothetical protein|nr:hypothetical protein [Hespellia sp.]
MGTFYNTLNNPGTASAVLVIVILISEMIRYKNHLYYTKIQTDPRIRDSMLNTRYHFNRRKNIDVNKINRYFFQINLAGIAVGMPIMVFYHVLAGFIVFLVISRLGSYLMMLAMGNDKIDVTV